MYRSQSRAHVEVFYFDSRFEKGNMRVWGHGESQADSVCKLYAETLKTRRDLSNNKTHRTAVPLVAENRAPFWITDIQNTDCGQETMVQTATYHVKVVNIRISRSLFAFLKGRSAFRK